MEQIIQVILESGRSAIDIALYILLPIMVVMMAIMKLLDHYGFLAWVARTVSPILTPLGIPGIGVFAAIKILLVSFAAPVASFTIMDQDGTSKRYIAAALAMIMTMSQANVVFPMIAVGLDLQVVLVSSIIGGLVAAITTFHLLARKLQADVVHNIEPNPFESNKNPIQIMIDGGTEGTKVVLAAIPMLILALCFVNTLKATDAISAISFLLATPLSWVGLPEAAVLPIVTKVIAGGTAYMGVTMDLLNQGKLTALELNRMAGLVIHPLDIVGVAIYALAGSRVASIMKMAIAGALVGITVRAIIHLLWF